MAKRPDSTPESTARSATEASLRRLRLFRRLSVVSLFPLLLALLSSTACSRTSDADARLATLEARLAATDASATSEAMGTQTAEAAVVSYANAIATLEAQATVRPTSAPIPPARPAENVPPQASRPAAPTLLLSGSFEQQVAQAGQYFIGLTQTTAQLMANAAGTDSWNSELRANMLGYRALADAWANVAAPACAAGHYRGLAAGYGAYADGAGDVLTALESSQAVLTAVTLNPDLVPLIKSGRSVPVSFEQAMLGGWGVSQQALQVGTAVQFIQAIGLWGLGNVDLGAFGIAYTRAGGAVTVSTTGALCS